VKGIEKKMKTGLTREQWEIMKHTKERAANGLFCGDSPDMQRLVELGHMESAGRKSFVPDEYFRLIINCDEIPDMSKVIGASEKKSKREAKKAAALDEITSPHSHVWKKLKRPKKGTKCEICGSVADLRAYRSSYKNQTLCGSCLTLAQKGVSDEEFEKVKEIFAKDGWKGLARNYGTRKAKVLKSRILDETNVHKALDGKIKKRVSKTEFIELGAKA